MSKPLTVTRADHTAAALRVMAAKCRDPAQLRRLLALALVLEGRSRTEVNRPGFVGGSHSQIGWSHDKPDDEQILS